jgi:tetratricopeptide (TPR) repeat protein
MAKREHLVFALLIAAITLAVYYDSFNNSFVYDDYPFLVDNPAVRDLTPGGFIAKFTDRNIISSCDKLAADVWRPLVAVSFALDYRLWGLKSRPYHVENAVLHIANALLVYISAAFVLSSPFTAFIAALVFAVHPAQTEAVTWVSGRSNVLFALFVLAAFIMHVRIRRRGGHGPEYSLIAVLFTLGLLSKEAAIVFPLICMLYDLHFHRGGRPGQYARYYAPLVLISAFYVAARFSVLGSIAQRPDWWGGSLPASLPVIAQAVAGYVAVALFPVNLRVEHVIDPSAAARAANLLPAALALFTAAALYAAFRRRREVSFYALWFFVALLPVCNIVPIKAVMAERFLYLPLVGFAGLFGIVFGSVDRSVRLKAPAKAVSAVFLALVIAAYGLLSIARNVEWRSEMSFYANEAARSPSSPKAHYNLAYIYEKEARRLKPGSGEAAAGYAMAISEFAKTVSLKPDSRIAYLGLGNALNAVGMYDKAALNLRKAMAFGADADLCNNLGVAYLRGGKPEEAEGMFRQALRIDPDNANAVTNLGNCLYLKGEPAAAAHAWRRARELDGPAGSFSSRLAELEKKGY